MPQLTRRTCGALLAVALGMTTTAFAQLPSSIGSASSLASEASGAAGAASGMTGICGKICQNLSACKAKFCASPCGQLMNQGMAPLRCLTGGSFGTCCPTTPSAAQQSQPGAMGAAAQIQADTAAAKARVAAVEYLGTVDCHYWPEAEKTLIDSLRADRNECVRFAAARVMASGCCCTKKTVAALTMAASGDDGDGNPSESSVRVRAAAGQALARCSSVPLESIRPTPPERPEPVRPELPSPISLETVDPGVKPASYYDTAEQLPRPVLMARARQAMALAAGEADRPGMPPVGSRSLLDIASNARASRPPSRSNATPTPAGPIRPVARRGEAIPVAAATPRRESPKTLMDVFSQSRATH